MAKSKAYEIELKVEGAERAATQLDQIDKGFNSISKAAKDLDFKGALTGVTAIGAQMRELAASGEDVTAQMKAFDRAAGKAYDEMEKQVVKLNYSLSEQGKLDRERIKSLKAEAAALGKTKADKARAKEITKELAALEKQVVQGTDAELKLMRQENRAALTALKLQQSEIKGMQQLTKTQRLMQRLHSDEVKGLKAKIKLVAQYGAEVLKASKAWTKVGTAAKKVGGVAVKAGKGAAVGAAGVVGAAVGMAVGAASGQVDREREANRIKAGMSQDAKRELLSGLYIRTGADAASIVDAVNRVVGVLGTHASAGELLEAAAAELRMPGAAALFRQQNVGRAGGKDFQAYMNRMIAVQGATGASVDQIAQSAGYIANLRQSSFSNASMTDLQSLYMALQNSGAFDSDEELQRAFRGFVREQASSGKDFWTLAREWQRGGRFERYVWGATNKTQVRNAMGTLDLAAVGAAAGTTAGGGKTASETVAEKMRAMEEKKNQILIKVMEALAPILDAIDTAELSNVFKSLVHFIQSALPLLLKVLEVVAPIIGKVMAGLSDALDYIATEWIGKATTAQALATAQAAQKAMASAIPGAPRATGGLVTMPSICGEAGPEAVIPLSPERAGRAMQILQTVNQSFSMSGNETTAMSLAGAMRSTSFGYESGRLGALQRRLGR